MIKGVCVTLLEQISDDRGKVMRMLRADDPTFIQFGEIYFSVINPGTVKAWRLHKEMTCNLAVLSGTVKLVLYDSRPNSPTYNEVQKIVIGGDNYVLVTIPPNIYNGFKNSGDSSAIIANCATHQHDSDEISRLEPYDNRIPYSWDDNN
jgi:dTDP-4-dehydrorhamnose 3,5-epimerase